METTVRGSTSGNSGASNSPAGPLTKVSSSVHAAVDSIAGAADEAARKAKPVIDQVSAMAHQAVDNAAGVAAPTADWLFEQGKSLKAAQKRMIGDTCAYISDNPLKSVGIAVVAGFLFSRIFVK